MCIRDRLYAGYAAFYQVAQTQAMRDTVWGWLLDPAHGLEALVAENDGVLIGLAHFRAFAQPLSASTGGFLDDLFVDPKARGAGAAAALLKAVADVGRARGWTVISWITAEDLSLIHIEMCIRDRGTPAGVSVVPDPRKRVLSGRPATRPRTRAASGRERGHLCTVGRGPLI